jgi:hypothetical protein
MGIPADSEALNNLFISGKKCIFVTLFLGEKCNNNHKILREKCTEQALNNS